MDPLACGMCGCDFKCVIFKLICDWYFERFFLKLLLCECQRTETVNIGLDNGLVLSSTKLLLEQMLTKFHDVIWHDLGPMHWQIPLTHKYIYTFNNVLIPQQCFDLSSYQISQKKYCIISLQLYLMFYKLCHIIQWIISIFRLLYHTEFLKRNPWNLSTGTLFHYFLQWGNLAPIL